MLSIAEQFRELLKRGLDFYGMSRKERIEYFVNLMVLFQRVPQFNFSEVLKTQDPDWRTVLSWWLFDPQTKPTPNKVSRWYAIANSLFSYLFSWAFSSALLVCIDSKIDLEASLFSDDPTIPKSALWTRELMQWGTTDPIVAAILQGDLVATRQEAEDIAQSYNLANKSLGDEMYDRDRVNNWVKSLKNSLGGDSSPKVVSFDLIELADTDEEFIRVRPEPQDGKTLWRSVSGYPIATSSQRVHAEPNLDYTLDVAAFVIRAEPYLS